MLYSLHSFVLYHHSSGCCNELSLLQHVSEYSYELNLPQLSSGCSDELSLHQHSSGYCYELPPKLAISLKTKQNITVCWCVLCGVQSFLPSPSTSSLWFIGILPGPTPLGIVFISFDKLIRALVHRYSTRTHSTGDCRPLRRQAPPRSGSSVFYPDPLRWGLSSSPLTGPSPHWFIGILPGPTPLGIILCRWVAVHSPPTIRISPRISRDQNKNIYIQKYQPLAHKRMTLASARTVCLTQAHDASTR